MGDWLRPGRTEAEVGADIAAAIVEEGHAVADFVIVGSGPNAASPHHSVSDRVIERGDVVVVDIGGPLPSACDDYAEYVTRFSAGGVGPYYGLFPAQRAARPSQLTHLRSARRHGARRG